MNDGQDYSYEELLSEFLPDEKRESGFVATDMDGTLFEGDLGKLVFLEKLAKPSDWQFTPNYFNRLLIPEDYQEVISRGAQGFINGLNPSECKRVIDLREDIIELYQHLYRLKTDQNINLKHPLANEFARKMMELDRLIMIMDPVLVEWFNGMLLMRTRFFAGQNKNQVSHLTRQVMRRKNHGKGRIQLAIHPENRGVYTQQRVRASHLERRSKMNVDRVVHAIPGTREIIFNLLFSGMPVRVITTNLKEIAKTALRESDYGILFDQDCDGKKPVVASALQNGHDGRFTPAMYKLPIFGEKKKGILFELQDKIRLNVMCALGDSPNNDTPMGEMAINNGGIFVAVGDDYESTRRRFDPFYKQVQKDNDGQNDISHRIWYVTKD
jgi:phosphoserine phosphatase